MSFNTASSASTALPTGLEVFKGMNARVQGLVRTHLADPNSRLRQLSSKTFKNKEDARHEVSEWMRELWNLTKENSGDMHPDALAFGFGETYADITHLGDKERTQANADLAVLTDIFFQILEPCLENVYPPKQEDVTPAAAATPPPAASVKLEEGVLTRLIPKVLRSKGNAGPAVVVETSTPPPAPIAATVAPPAQPIGVRFSFSDEAVNKLTRKFEREARDVSTGAGLAPNEVNGTWQFSANQIAHAFRNSVDALKIQLRKKGYPNTIRDITHREGVLFTAIETFFLTGSFAFITYGNHGFAQQWLEKWALDAANDTTHPDPNSLAHTILSNPALDGALTWGYGATVAVLLSSGILYGMKRFRKRTIDIAEAKHAGRKAPKRSMKDLVLPMSILAVLWNLAMEVPWMLSRYAGEAEARHIAFDMQNRINNLLDINNPTSPVAKGSETYSIARAKAAYVSDALPTAEATRPGAAGQGPAYVADEALRRGPQVVLADPTLAKDKNLTAIVQRLNDQLAGIDTREPSARRDLHQKQPTFVGKIDTVAGQFRGYSKMVHSRSPFGKLYEDAKNPPNTLAADAGLGERTMHWLSSVFSHEARLSSVQLNDAKRTYLAEVEKYLRGVQTLNGNMSDRMAVYQSFVNDVVDIANKKYKSNLQFDASVQLPVPNLSELENALRQPLPRIEGKGPWESFNTLLNLAEIGSSKGGIDKIELAGILGWVGFRAIGFELAGLALLFLAVWRIRRSMKHPDNLLSNKFKQLEDGAYDKLVDAIHATFSEDHWKSIFPNHAGITRDQAESIARRFMVQVNPALDYYMPIGDIEWEAKRTVGHGLRGFGNYFKGIFMGDTRTHAERHLKALNDPLTKLSNKANPEVHGIALPDAFIADIVRIMVPDMPVGKMPTDTRAVIARLNEIMGQVIRNTDTVAKKASHTVMHETEHLDAEMGIRLGYLQEWQHGELVRINGQVCTYISEHSDPTGDAHRVRQHIEEFIRMVEQPHPTSYHIRRCERKRRYVIEGYKRLFPDDTIRIAA